MKGVLYDAKGNRFIGGRPMSDDEFEAFVKKFRKDGTPYLTQRPADPNAPVRRKPND